jgi:hypothetical protein
MMKTPYTLDNTQVKDFIAQEYPDVYDKDSFLHLVSPDIEDRLYGATRQGDWNVKTSSYKIFMLLGLLDNINVESVSKLMNARQESLYGKRYSVRSLQRWVAVLACASSAIGHYLHNNNAKLS